MERFTPDESLTYAALEFDRAVLQVEQSAICCDMRAIGLQVAQQETYLVVIDCHQARNQLAQEIQKFHDRRLCCHED
jgi:hypothetical protein